MTLKEQIGKDIITAMKEKDVVKRDTLKYVKSKIQSAEMEKNAKVVDDGKTVQIIKKIIGYMKESGDEESLVQVKVLEDYVPTMLSENVLRVSVEGMIKHGVTNMGQIIKGLNEQFPGKIDNKVLSGIAKELLNK
jgi:uncharacterized protein YqeY